jgi:DNA-directed RNA polymerase subunit RPC12/RpoP
MTSLRIPDYICDKCGKYLVFYNQKTRQQCEYCGNPTTWYRRLRFALRQKTFYLFKKILP